MRRTLQQFLAATLVFAAASAGAGDTDRSLQQRFDEFEVARRATVMQALALTPEQAKAFEPLYDEYRVRNRRLVDRRLEQLRIYAEVWDRRSADSRAVRDLSREMFAIERQHLSDLQAQLDRVSRALPPGKVLDYLLLEVQLDLRARHAALELVPGYDALPAVGGR